MPVTAPARPTCCGSASRRSGRSTPQPGEDVELAAEESRLGHADSLRVAAEGAREALSSDLDQPDALGAVAAARAALEGVRDHDPQAAELADRVAELSYVLADLAADVASYASGLETDPARLAAVSERRAALVALTRKYGETVDEVLAWQQRSAARLLELDGTDERIEQLRDARDRLHGRPDRRRRRALDGPRRGRRTAGRPGHRRAGRPRHAARPGRGRGDPARPVRQLGSRRRRVPAGRQRRQPTPARWPRVPRAASCRG